MKKILAFLLAIIMVLGSVPALAEDEDAVVDSSQPVSMPKLAASPSAAPGDFGELIVDNYNKDDPTKYDSENRKYFTDDGGTFTYADNVLTVLGGTVSLSGSTASRVVVAENATLILNGVSISPASDGAAIKIEPEVQQCLITLQSSTENTVTGKGNYAGIEVGYKNNNIFASLTIDGNGTLNATGGGNSAAIGGSYDNRNEDIDKTISGYYGNITIDGGIINASSSGGAAIGSSNNNRQNVDGTTNTSASYKMCANENEDPAIWGTIIINGGIVNAVAAGGAAGIGGGNHADSGEIIINGGTVFAHGNGGGAGIGSGIGSQKQEKDFTKGPGYYYADITINGGEIEAKSGWLGAGIGGGYSCDAFITINDCKSIVATGGPGNDGANYHGGTGIGGGYAGLSVLKIKNGQSIYAKGGTGAPGIGYGPGALEGDTNKERGRGATIKYTKAGITINNGNIEAHGGINGAGIGSGNGDQYCSITITGGNIKAYGYSDSGSPKFGGAGIGSGTGIDGGSTKYKSDTVLDITISGNATITAVGGNGAAGIGSGAYNKDATIAISGGTINASSNGYGAGIGAGIASETCNVTISGGKITAKGAQSDTVGKEGGAGIGSGTPGQGDELQNTNTSVSVTGGDVYAEGGWGAAGIGSGADNTRAASITIGESAEVRAYSDGTKFALDTRDGTGSNTGSDLRERYVGAEVLQGTFMFPWSSNSGTQDARGLSPIKIVNENSDYSKTLTDLPDGYRSFATNVSGEGVYSIYTNGNESIASGSKAYFSVSQNEETSPNNKNNETVLLPLQSGKLSDNFFLYPVKTIIVEKEVKAADSLKAGINLTAYFRLKLKGQDAYLPGVKTIEIVNGVPQNKAYFVNVPEGSYSITEVDKDGNRMNLNTVFGTVVLTSIETKDQSGSDNTGTISDSQWLDSVTVINTYEDLKKDVSGEKTWNDANNQDGIRPSEITVRLVANGAPTNLTATVTPDENGAWKYTFKNVPINDDNGDPYTYTVTENKVEGYTFTTEGMNIENVHIPETVPISGEKTWEDADNQDGKRPASIIITLYANGVEKEEKTVTAADGWKWDFGQLPKFAQGKEIQYTITEEPVTDYTAEISGYDVINTHEPELIDLTVKKVWDDADNQDGKRPDSLAVTLSNGKTVTLNEANQWTATVKDLPKYADGKEIQYTWKEDALPAGYTLTGTSVNGTVTTLTNSYIPETTEASVKKVWEDADNQDGKRPASLAVTLSNGDKVTLNAANNWTAKIENLPKYANGEEIQYTWTEEALPEGYTLTNTSVNGTVTTLTNSHTPETTEASVTKVWNDADNQDGKRPASLTVTLSNGTEVTLNADNSWTATVKNLPKYANGEEIKYTWTEETLPEGYILSDTTTNGTVTTLTNSHTPETTEATVTKVWDDADNQDGKRPDSLAVTLSNGKTVTLNEANQWTATVKDLPKYADGKEIEYTWKEDALPAGYTLTNTSVNGTVTTLTNSHTPETTEATVTKVWDDADNQDGKRPASLTVTLSNGTEVTLNAANNWTAMAENLPKYANGEEIQYTWTEEALPEGYTLTNTSVNGTVTTLTNSHTPETTEATVTKVWNDADNQDGKRPASLTVTLSNGDKVTLNAANSWTAKIENLPKYADGKEIQYTWTEETLPEGYTLTNTSVNGTVTTLTNSHTPETTEATVTKVWNDANDQDKIRPVRLTVSLRNGVSVTLSAANNWTAKVENLPKYDQGREISYTWREETIEGYTLTNTAVNGTITTLTNTHTPEPEPETVPTISVDGVKVWNDRNDQDGLRPASVTIRLLANGEPVDSRVVTAEDNWAFSFRELPQFRDGVAIVYTITEDEVPGYTTAIAGYIVTNTHETATRTINGAKTWNDDNDRDGLRPASITVNLLADGAVVRSTAVTAANGWAWSFENVDRYREGREIVYTVTENAVPGYTAEVLGYSIRNTHEPERVSVNGVKVWNDENNMDGLRPASVTVNLLANGTQVASRAVTGTGDTWNYTFDNLPRNENGQPIVYTVTEDPVPGYTAQIAGTTITNTHEPARITVSGVKTWADQEDADGLRPASIVVNLLADGRRVDSQTVTGSGSTWRYTFADLPQYVNGREIVYTVSETAPEGYTAQISGTDITNTHVPARVDVRGTKSWADHDDADGLRPASITLRLLADGQETDRQTVTGSGTEWAYAFTDLPEYKDGRKITYTVTEDAVPEYETVITGYNVFNIHHPSEEIPGEELYKLTVRYWADGKTAFPDFTATYHFGDRYDVVSPVKQGYTVDLPEVVGVIYQDTVVDVYYTPNPVHLTVFYQYLDGTTAADTHYETLMPGDDYNVPSPVLPGYTASMAVVAGTMPGRDVEFVVVYVAVIVPGQPVPEDDPDQPVQLYEFDDLNTPLGLGNVELNAGDCFE